MNTKYIFLDVDGTLVDFKCTMPESARVALIEAQKNGHKLIISTGRFLAQIYPWLLETIHFDGIVTSSGANIVYEGERVFVKHFTREQLIHLDNCFRKVDACYSCQIEEALISTEEDYARMCVILAKAGASPEAIESFRSDLIAKPMYELEGVQKAIYCGAELDLGSMRALLGDKFNIDPFSFMNMPSSCGEVNLAEINKGNAIKILMDRIGADILDTIAFGDGGNDITMIKVAGVGVAMGNAVDEVKSVADMVTDDIDKDGIYNAFVRLGVI